MIRINNIKLSLDEDKNRDKNLKNKIIKKLKIKPDMLLDYKIFKMSIDSRKKHVGVNYIIDVSVIDEAKFLKKGFTKSPNFDYTFLEENKIDPMKVTDARPIVVGFGPAGLFASYMLAKAGLKPIILEMGSCVEKRERDINNYWKHGVLDIHSNVQFGEGGAGTFSDGKLTTRIKDPRCREVLNHFVAFGGPEEILFENKPHIGTDILKDIIKNMRQEIIEEGGEVIFDAMFKSFKKHEGILEVTYENLIEQSTHCIKGSELILAIGHSSRDTFEYINDLDFNISPKPFAVGIRVEHAQKFIDENQYPCQGMSERYGASSYQLKYNTEDGRGVYSFCMCPGGVVVGAASEQETFVVNGMSYHARNEENANSALLVSVYPEDFEGHHPLRGMYFQRKLEQDAFKASKGHHAPAMYVGDLLKDYKTPYSGEICPEPISSSHTNGIHFSDFNDFLPPFIIEPLKEGLLYFDKKIPGFSSEKVIMTAVESRSSSPIVIHRDLKTLTADNYDNIYPCGEGAGYAGGIMSSAVDGIKVAEQVILRYKK